MSFAIVQIAGHQYKVSVGDTITVDRLKGEVGEKLTFDCVLLTSDGDKTAIGTPHLPIAVVGTILSHTKGEKIRVARFKAKSRYRRVRGFRPFQTVLRIESIGDKTSKIKKKAAKAV